MGIIANWKARRDLKKSLGGSEPYDSTKAYNNALQKIIVDTGQYERKKEEYDSTKVTSPTTPSPNRSGGGGSSSSGISTPTNQPTQNLGGDTPSSYSGGTSNAYQPPTIKNYMNTNSTKKYDSFQDFVSPTGSVYPNKVSKIKSWWDKLTDAEKRKYAIEQEKQKLQTGMRTTPSGDGQGTDITSQVPYTQEEVVKSSKDFGFSVEATTDFLVNKANEKIQNQKNFDLKVPIAEIQSQTQIEYSNIYSALASQVSAGVITRDRANELLKQQAEELNIKTQKKVEDLETQWNNTTGKQLIENENKNINKQLDKIAISRGVQTSLVAGAVVGAGATAIAGTSAIAGKVIQTAGNVALGVGVAKTGKYFVENAGTGTLTPSRIGAVLLPQLAFVGGATLGSFGYSRLSGAGKIDQVKLTEALKTASVEIKDVKAITNQNQLKAYKLPENLQLGDGLNYGRSVRIIEYELKGLTPEQTALIKKAFPNLKIKSYEVADQNGNTINRKYILEKDIAGKKSLIDYETGQSLGEYRPDLKANVMETISLDVAKGKQGGFTEARKSLQITQEPKTKIILQNGELKRVSISDTFSFEGKKVTAPKGETLTYGNLQDIVNAENFKKFPSSRVKAVEFDELTGIRINTASAKKGDVGIGLENIGLDFKNIGLKIKSEKIPKQIEFKIDKKSKPFELPKQIEQNILPPKIEKVKIPINEGPQLNLEQVQKNLNKQTRNLPNYDFSESILKSVKESTKQRQVPIVENQLKFLYNQKNLQKNLNSLGINYNSLYGFKTPQSYAQALKQLGIQDTSQLTKLKTSQFTPQDLTYDFKFPTPPIKPGVTSIDNPFLNLALSGGKYSKGKKSKRKEVNPIGKYSASLFNAAFGKPINVSKSQFEKLSKQTYLGLEGSRPLLNIVPDKSIQKAIKKLNFNDGTEFSNLKKQVKKVNF